MPESPIPELAGKLTVTVPVAARALGVSKAFGYQLARTGDLPGVRRLGGRLVVSVPELLRYLGVDENGHRPGGGAK
jgi:hypothetical protein